MKNITKRIWEVFIQPKSIDENNSRKEFILNVVLLTFLFFLFLLTCLFLYNFLTYSDQEKIYSSGIGLIIWVFFSFLLYFSRIGYTTFASYGLLVLFTLFSTFAAIEWGFDLPAVIISYLLIIVISTILFDYHIGIIITLILCIFIFSISFIQIKIKIPNLYWRQETPEMIDAITYSIELLFIMSISWLSNYLINKSLKEAKESETRLSLELERIEKIYHFAEFGKLSSGVFHDLISPLTTISLNIDELSNSINPSLKDFKKNINCAVIASKRMSNFISIIEKRISHQTIISEFNVNNEIEQAIELVSHKARRSNCNIIFISNDKIDLIGNSLTMYQAITNLLSNAIDSYSQLKRRNKIIKVILFLGEEDIIIKICDKGVGMCTEKIKNIFEPFYTTKIKHSGLGLGLSLTREKLEKDFGGTLSVSSRPNYGSTFIVKIPKPKSLDTNVKDAL